MDYLNRIVIVWLAILGCSNAYDNAWCSAKFGTYNNGPEYKATSAGFCCYAWPPDSNCRDSSACCATCFSTRCFSMGGTFGGSSSYTCCKPTPPPTPSPIPFDIDETRGIDCDLASVNYGEDLTCALDVTVHDDQPGGGELGTVTILNQFNFSDSSGNQSYCYNPTLSISYIDNDFDDESEYLSVGLVSGASAPWEIARCGQGNGNATCESKSCLNAYPYPGSAYVDESSELTVQIVVSAAVEGVDPTNAAICSGGNVIEANLTIACTRTDTHSPTLSPVTKTPTSPTTATTTALPTISTTNTDGDDVTVAGDVDSNGSIVSPMIGLVFFFLFCFVKYFVFVW